MRLIRISSLAAIGVISLTALAGTAQATPFTQGTEPTPAVQRNGTPAPAAKKDNNPASLFASNPSGGCELQVTGGSPEPAMLYVNGTDTGMSIAPTPPAPVFQFTVNADNGVVDGPNTLEIRADDDGQVLATYVMNAQCDTETPGEGDELDAAVKAFTVALRAYIDKQIAEALAEQRAGA